MAWNNGHAPLTKIRLQIPAGCSDELIIELVKERIAEPDCRNGYLFDGFPRTIPQADAMKTVGVRIDYVLDIDVPDSLIVERLNGRWVHAASGRSYHLKFSPPKNSGIDDVSGEPLIQRADDKAETVAKRLAVYHEQTEPLIGYYTEWAVVDGDDAPSYRKIEGIGTIEQICGRILSALRPSDVNCDVAAG